LPHGFGGDSSSVLSVNNSPPKTIAARHLSIPADVSKWKTYSTKAYGFSISYPSNLVVYPHNGSSDFDKNFLALEIGTAKQIADLRLPSLGSGGPPLFLRIVASTTVSPVTCGDDNAHTENIVIDNKTLIKCEGVLEGSFQSLYIPFTNGKFYYTIESNMYSNDDKSVIENILSTFKLF
jgi:hypothetical protein